MDTLRLKDIRDLVPDVPGRRGRPRRQKVIPYPTVADLNRAHEVFEKREPRALFYRVAIEIVELALAKKTSLQITDGIAVLLKTWNNTFYRFRGRPFGENDFNEIDRLVSSHKEIWMHLRISSLVECDVNEAIAGEIFAAFREPLGPVGAAKSLHLLAPQYLPLWDGPIAKNYGFSLDVGGYLKFMAAAKEQCHRLGGRNALDRNLLKALDEYNYCRGQGWDF
jgi:hypothetical protein